MSRYFAKELPDSPVYVLGHPLKFDFLETEDTTLIGELSRCAQRGAGGVREISKAEYDEEVKKKELGLNSSGGLKQRSRRVELSALLLSPAAVGAAGSFAKRQGGLDRETMETPRPTANLPDPIQVPSVASFTLPPTAKIGQMDKAAIKAKG